MDYAEIEMPTENINFLGGRGLVFFLFCFFIVHTIWSSSGSHGYPHLPS